MDHSLVSVSITTFSPFPTIQLELPRSLSTRSLPSILEPLCPIHQQSLSLSNGKLLPISQSTHIPISSIASNDGNHIGLRLVVKLPGGKGGFASQLRAQGGRMSSNKATNNDSCRDLNGRRLSTIKEAKKLAAYISSAPDRAAAQAQAAQEKLATLNAEIERLDAAASGSNKRRLDDHKYVEESKGIVEGVRDAVKEAMKAKRKKAKLDAEAAAAGGVASAPVSSVKAAAVDAPVASGSGSGSKELQSMKENADVAPKAVTENGSPEEDVVAAAVAEPVEDEVVKKPVKGKGPSKRTAKK
ncbi:hypothetical protein T439DRAFT_377941 [Meredithblackwellia eburnea MCA 4105]